MSWWEYIAKHTVKGILWAIAYVVTAVSFSLEPTWRLLLFAVICGFVGDLLDRLITTETRSQRCE